MISITAVFSNSSDGEPTRHEPFPDERAHMPTPARHGARSREDVFWPWEQTYPRNSDLPFNDAACNGALRAELRGAQVRPVAYVALSGDLPGFLPITELGAWILVSPIEEWAAVWERGGEGKRLSMSSP
ncbi:hypothetical protein B0J12DRAFT_696102 [Macrophomina phaseolina]|uniref:Uncharacterized protein n=1 Tax=Macrophomina phaseolina TaxID=35725 RepID=A0ABQ8GQ88_9PEZI|nr:hypothetical protein B0J12DRAFT_696102 [Macrophomina phaseolina]